MRPEYAIFAGGCFWCMEPPFDNTEGVLETIVGYTGGTLDNPTYEQVSRGGTGHREAVRVAFDPARVSYQKLLEVFWRNIDPTQDDGQFADRGTHYRTAIYVLNETQRALAEQSRQALIVSGKFKDPIVTEILEARPFYPAEEYHQNYYKKEQDHYEMYKRGSGRAGFIEHTWKDK
ncbi:MAG: peptide-methionine (S)-S-oxide reductase MsrA [Bdellovibrionota bacterium]|nr:MAG: peptide-methionine (S)-S-oxide reductase MsrA [Bdellovibrionota bacterium]